MNKAAWASLAPLIYVGCLYPFYDPLCDELSDPLPTPLMVRGVNLVGFQSAAYVAENNHLDDSLNGFVSVGGNWIAVNFWWFQDSVTAGEIGPDETLYTISNEAIESAVRSAHAKGLRVLLRPMLDVRDGDWRGSIRPSEDWFESYRRYILAYAERAARWQTAAISVGAELSATEPWESHWRRLVDDVRTLYPGLIVYSAVHDAASRVAWWDAVDVIGIDEYSPAALFPGASTCAMKGAWGFWLDQIERGVVQRFPGKSVWLTETGVRSARGAITQPSCWQDPCGGFVDGTMVDREGQADYYRAALWAAGAQPWLQGIFWWSWDPDPTAPYVAGPDFSPQGKPAEDVLAEFWGSSLQP